VQYAGTTEGGETVGGSSGGGEFGSGGRSTKMISDRCPYANGKVLKRQLRELLGS